jgi:hypothetical protein
MKNSDFQKTYQNKVIGNKIHSKLFLAVFISLHSLLLNPAYGQNGISVCQSEKVRTESPTLQIEKRGISFSFIKLFFQLNKSISFTDKRPLAWVQSQLNFALRVNQLLRNLELQASPRPLYLKSNIPHSNPDEYHVEFLS